MTEENTSVTERYNQIRLLIESLEADAIKTENGNKTAALRLRKALRLLKNQSADLVKFTLKS